MKLLITGTPSFSLYTTIAPSIIELLVDYYDNDITFLTSGGKSNKVEQTAKIFAHFNDIPCTDIPDTEKLIKEADEALVFWDNKSRETRSIIDKFRAIKRTNPTIVRISNKKC